MSDEDEGHLLADAVHVVHGEAGTGAGGRILYGIYVTVMLAVTYGFTLAKGLFSTADPATLHRELTSWPALGVGLAVVVVLVGLARAAGRTRGPVVPPLPWIDHVVSASLDRALAVRQWWRYAAAGGLAGGVVLGAALGGGAWAATVGGPLWLLVGIVAGPVLGWCLVIAWLSGQAAADEPTPTGVAARGWALVRVSRVLRLLGVDELRRQSARSTRLGGGVLAGDLRAVRLEVAPPVSRGRSWRLRSGGPQVTVVRRDALGLRRTAGTAGAGAVVTALAAAGVAWSVDDPAAPAALAWLAVAAAYLGFGWWSEGLRLQADNGGTTPLLGVWGRSEASAHLVSPGILFVVVGGLTAAATGAVEAGSAPVSGVAAVLGPVAWLVVVGGAVGGGQLLAAFRGQPPKAVFATRSGPGVLTLLWYAGPFVLTVIGGGSFLAAASSPMSVGPLVGTAVVGTVLMSWGFARVDALESAHRE